jgi:hypothetical protein
MRHPLAHAQIHPQADDGGEAAGQYLLKGIFE